MEECPDKTDEFLDLFTDIQINILNEKSPYLTTLNDKMNRKISESDFDATTRYELHTRLNKMSKHNKICHGDFNPSNIIIHPDGTPDIIDWTHVTQGNGSADAARTYLIFRLSNQNELAEKYLRLYCKKTDTARQYINEWLAIVAASQSLISNQYEKELLQSWVNVCDYQ
jgi:thiamine kinase-like enzyme